MALRRLPLYKLVLLGNLLISGPFATAYAQNRSLESERQKLVTKQQFTQSFRNIQVSSQELLREHENGKLTVTQLNKIARSINRSSKMLRELMALGALAEASEPFEKSPSTSQEFNKAIKQLYQLIYDFAHSPVHKNPKVFNTKHAAKAQIQLLTIIELSKALEDKARDYTAGLTVQDNVRQ